MEHWNILQELLLFLEIEIKIVVFFLKNKIKKKKMMVTPKTNFEVILSEMLCYIEASIVWMKDFQQAFKNLIAKTNDVFMSVENAHNVEKDAVQTALHAGASFLFMWKLMAFDEDAVDDFSLTYKLILRFLLPSNLSVASLQCAENRVLQIVFASTYIISCKSPKKRKNKAAVLTQPAKKYNSATI